MDTLSKIPSEGNWQDIATRANENFTKVSTELGKLGMTTSVKMPLFASLTEAQNNIPKPYFGQLILIGSTLPAPVYKWNGSSWVNTGITGGSASVPLTDYYTKTEIDARLVKIKTTNKVRL